MDMLRIPAPEVQNFEPHAIIENCFKNKGFIWSWEEQVKNFEPGCNILVLKFCVVKNTTISIELQLSVIYAKT